MCGELGGAGNATDALQFHLMHDASADVLLLLLQPNIMCRASSVSSRRLPEGTNERRKRLAVAGVEKVAAVLSASTYLVAFLVVHGAETYLLRIRHKSYGGGGSQLSPRLGALCGTREPRET